MATHAQPHSHRDVTRMTIDFPVGKHRQLKAIAALVGIPMKEFILKCVLEKLDSKKILEEFEEKRDAEAEPEDLAPHKLREQAFVV